MIKYFFLSFFAFTFLCAQQHSPVEIQTNAIAEAYMKLVLAVGVHDGNYVDAYYGAVQRQDDAKKEQKPLLQIKQKADTLLSQLAGIIPDAHDEMILLRHNYAYRSYVINYNLGKDMVKEYINSKGDAEENAQQRWREFAKLISSPKLISGVQ